MARTSSPIRCNDFDYNQPCQDVENGNTVSLVAAICLAAILFVLVGISASYPSYDGDAHRILWMVLLILISLALLSIITIFVMSKVRRSTWIASNENKRNVCLKCIFMWLCGTVVLVDVLFAFCANIQCVLQNMDEPFFYIYYATVHVLYFIYYIMQNVFIQVFRNTRFYNRVIFNVTISFITIANATIGFNAYVGHHGIYKPVNQTISANSSDAARESVCYINSEMGNLHNRLKPYFVPCRIEYTLLVAYFVFTLWQSAAVNAVKCETIQAPLIFTDEGSYRQLTSPCADEPAQSSTWPMNISSVSIPVTTYQLSEKSRKCIIGYGILSNIILIVGSWMQVQYKTNAFDSHFSNYLFLFYKIYTLIILTLAFHVLSEKQNRHQSLGKIMVSEFFLVMAGSGATAVCTFDMMVSLKVKTGADIAFVIASAITIIDIQYQIILLFTLRRTYFHQMDKTLKILLLLLGIANFIHWISDTFIVVPHFKRERYIEDVYGEEIAKFDHYAIFPLLMYFRLVSGIELIDFYKRS